MLKSNRLFCFSPPVMLATFVIEIGLLIYTVWRYKLTPVTRLVALLLLFLASFQLAEYMVCGGWGMDAQAWTRYGFASITILPALGMHLAIVLAKKRLPWLIALAYASAAVFVYYFIFVSGTLSGNECRPNYVVFHVEGALMYLYVLYYYGWLAVTTTLTLLWAKGSKHKKQLHGLAAGYLVFIIPTVLATAINPANIAGIPSIMCGFAVLMALALVVWVAPGAAKDRTK